MEGRGSEIAGSQLPVIGLLHPGSIGQGQQRGYRQHQPMAGDARGVGPPGLMPLPAQTLDGLETQFDPETQGIPTHPNRLRWLVGQYDPRFQLIGVPDHQQGATAFGGVLEGSSAADPSGIGTGDEGLGGQSPATLGTEGDVFRVSDVGMPALRSDLTPQFGTGQAPVAQHYDGHLSRHCWRQGLQQLHCRVHPAPGTLGGQDAPGHGNGAASVEHADHDGGSVIPLQCRVNGQSQAVATPPGQHPFQQRGEAEAHVQFRPAGTRPVAAVVEPFPQVLAQAVPTAPGRERGGNGALAGAASEDGPANPQRQASQLWLGEVR